MSENNSKEREEYMTVWVWETTGFTAAHIVPLLNINVSAKRFYGSEGINKGDILIVQKCDYNVAIKEDVPCQILVYEDLLHDIATSIYREMESKRDYYYLINTMNKAKSAFIDTVITGSSHGLFGIDEQMLTHEVNASLISQDLYYSLKIFYKLWEDNPGIKNVVLCFGYYIPFSDLSMVRIPLEQQRISTVYYPVFGDAHNAVIYPPSPRHLLQSHIFDIDKIADASIRAESMKPYFHKDNPRSRFALRLWDDRSKDWLELSEEERADTGKKRAIQHNGNLKHFNSLRENITLFHRFMSFCMQKQIQVLMVVMPASKYYCENLDPAFMETYYDILDGTEGTIHLLDLFADESFDNSDFLDTDHLNDQGAKKATYKILEVLREMRDNKVEGRLV